MRWKKQRSKTLLALLLSALSWPAYAGALPSWSDQIEALKDVAEPLIAESERGASDESRQDMYRYVLGAISNGYLNYVNMDRNRPTWAPLWNYAFNYGGPNPDYAYMFTLVDAKGVYKISGYRGTSRFVEITQQPLDYITNANLAAMRKSAAAGAKPVALTNDLDSLHVDKDGYFSVILSAQRPARYEGDWWQLGADTHALLMRKTSADWRHEVDPRIAIERLDGGPPMSAQEIAARFSDLKNWVFGTIDFDIRLASYYREHHGINTIKRSELMDASNNWGQVYFDGTFQIADNEALILDTAVPAKCRYWQILLADNRFATVDWVNHQSSLNDYQAHLDKDGRFRAVIAVKDPGVPNWLDTGGNPWGIIQMRWNRCSEAPEPTVKKVALKDVRKYLPKDTPIVSPADRKEQLRLRREAAQFRQLW